jgi:hypothetical protein
MAARPAAAAIPANAVGRAPEPLEVEEDAPVPDAPLPEAPLPVAVAACER